MQIKSHIIAGITIAEITSDKVIINTVQDALDLLGNVYYQDFEKVIIHEQHLTPDFFDLKNGMAGEVLQKFFNYRIGLAIVGDFTKYTKQSMKDFMYESNRTGHVNFVGSVEEGLDKLAKT